MAARKIKDQPASIIGSPVAIYYDSEWQEYQVKVKGMPDATYFTDDKNDAKSTAQRMRNTIAFKNPAKRKTVMTASQVRAAFNIAWRNRIRDVPAYKNDLPAKRQFFSMFLDELYQDDLITENMVNNVTMSSEKAAKKNPAPRKTVTRKTDAMAARKIKLPTYYGSGRTNANLVGNFTKEGAMRAGKQFLTADLKNAGFSVSVFESPNGYYVINIGKTVKANPAPRKSVTRKTDATTMGTAKRYVNRKSQITKGKPSERLVNRRIKNLQAPVGLFPNPIIKGVKKSRSQLKRETYPEMYAVEISFNGETWRSEGLFDSLAKAKEYARALDVKHENRFYIRVVK